MKFLEGKVREAVTEAKPQDFEGHDEESGQYLKGNGQP